MRAAMERIAENLSAFGVTVIPSRESANVLIAVVNGAAGPHVVRIDGDGPTLRLSVSAGDEALEVTTPTVGSDAGELHGALTTLVRAVEESLRQPPSLPPHEESDWRCSGRRRVVLEALAPWGRLLSGDPPLRNRQVHMGERLRALQKNLLKMRRPHALLIGHPGTGKTALVQELARRIAHEPDRLLPALRDRDIFELSVTGFRGGSGARGEYEERM